MNLIPKGHRHNHRGVIGIESAIVLIAFVIVAAALAFVVLNMGFLTSQKAKTSIKSALDEAGSSLSIAGKVIGLAQGGVEPLQAISIPLKLTSGGESVDLSLTRAKISYLGEDVEFDNIYLAGCTLNGIEYESPTAAWLAAETVCTNVGLGDSPYAGGQPGATAAIIYWAVDDGNFNTILSEGEHAILSIGWAVGDEPNSLEKLKAELTVSGGATLTIERNVPNISDLVVDLG